MTREGYLKHKELIEAWVNGAKIQWFNEVRESWFPAAAPQWDEEVKYRVKPALQWEDFGKIKGFHINSYTEQIQEVVGTTTDNNYKTVFPTKEEAEACLALSQLLQWRDKYNEGWKPDWNSKEVKYVIEIIRDEIDKTGIVYGKRVLAFKSIEIRNKFFEDFKDLIEIAKPLL